MTIVYQTLDLRALDMIFIEWSHVIIFCYLQPIFMATHKAGMKTQQSTQPICYIRILEGIKYA